ncbi:docking domain of Afi1 for Arf3 in vesicle trafficking-domain-containing protein [Gorgonomyces haynaldii]|nr:docking domain of Afi1 for Arf3 in vesicle trafficking-domain-containing protein [Gorgonomyces haynaldii]
MWRPLNSTAVDYVLAAEFDIDKGSTLAFQYPQDTGVDPSLLAEWMLPEGSHLHQQDATWFVINNEERTPTPATKSRYLVELVAMVFINQKQWTLLDGLEEHRVCLQENQIIVTNPKDQKEKYWFVANAEVIYQRDAIVYFPSVFPQLCIRFKSVDERVYFTDYLHSSCHAQWIPDLMPSDLKVLVRDNVIQKPLLYVFNLVAVKHIEGVKRGARVKSLAICSRHTWIHVFKPLLLMALDDFFSSPTIDVLRTVYNVLNSEKFAELPLLTLMEKRTIRLTLGNRIPHLDPDFKEQMTQLRFYDELDTKLELLKDPKQVEVQVPYSGIPLPLKIPLLGYYSEIGSFSVVNLLNLLQSITILPQTPTKQFHNSAFCWHPHLDSGNQTHPIILFLFALLSEKRIMFVGYQKPCTDLANCVLASIALASAGDLVPGTVHRCFPYASLANIDLLLKVPGYVAGVTNPVFEQNQSWWDILINLNSNQMIISQKLVKEFHNESSAESIHCEDDDELIRSIFSGLDLHLEENHMRQLVYTYLERFIERLPLLENSQGYRGRVMGWKASRAYGLMSEQSYQKSLFKDPTVIKSLSKLMYSEHLDIPSLIQCYEILDTAIQSASDPQLIQILSQLPSKDGSAFPFSIGLFHPRHEIQMAAARIILRLHVQKIGPEFLNPMILDALRSTLGIVQSSGPPIVQQILQRHETNTSQLSAFFELSAYEEDLVPGI